MMCKSIHIIVKPWSKSESKPLSQQTPKSNHQVDSKIKSMG